MKKIRPSLIIYAFSVAFIIFVFLTLLSFNIIGYGVQERCQLAQEKYLGDCVEALIQYLEDEDTPFQSRNSAIWALGELGDARALPALQGLYTGDIPKRESLSQTISQYELKKAIKLINGFNVTAFFWRDDSARPVERK
ncbi:HEAT repeat domain-containing protein [Patescibacteria group bacterium]|nr:HEAT repeat domain-containing protein [Patescibacteria group bacterium]MBU1922429.1 HEAT repeat domain-containing protein [Patescibacteria group bacterium]